MRRSHTKVPEFSLYGESAVPNAALHLHIEDIQSRARLYQWEIVPHRHANLCQLLFIERGPASIHVDELAADVPGPALAIVPPGTVHAFQFSDQTQGFVLTLPSEQVPMVAERDMRELLQGVFAQGFVGMLGDDAGLAARLHGLLARLHAEFREPEAEAAPITAWLANSVLWLLARHLARARAASARAPTRQRAWLKFRALAETHYHEQWHVGRYARQLGMTTGRLNRLCHEQSGLTASRVLQQRLSLEARRRLIYVDVPIARIAAELGFRDAAYFCRFFKRHTGSSPRAFRQAAWNR